jgi:hypothetical protein
MGTTTSAAMASGRNSVGYEIDPGLEAINLRVKEGIIQTAQQVIHQRLVNHLDFVVQRTKSKGRLKHENIPYGFPVMTTQEKELLINQPLEIQSSGKNIFTVEYASTAQPEFCRDWTNLVRDDDKNSMVNELKDQGKRQNFKQQSLF